MCVSSWSAWCGPRMALPRVQWSGGESAGDVDAHGPGGAGHDLLGLLDRVGVEVGHLGLRDLAKLVAGDAADLVLVRLAAALVDPGGLLDELGGRRRLGDEGERPVLVDADLYGDDVAALGLRGSVVLLAEVHDVDAVRTERGTDRRCGRRLAGLQLDLDDRGEFLPGRHASPLAFLFCFGPDSRLARATR